MFVVCIQAFGNFVPGDEVLIPDGAVFDTTYFAAKADKKVDAPKADANTKKENSR